MIIEFCDKLYPEKLRELKKPPSRLYVNGNIDIINNYGIAVIGSRSNTHYGEKMCKMFTKNLVEYGFNIISGLAIGIDSIAHKTSLKNSGKTIAVLPSGLKNIYPDSNKLLAKQIIENGGLLVSEYENNVSADSNKFRERNRIVAGLAIGTLVIEAGKMSGTRITARNTLEQHKPLFAIPSNLDNLKGKTTNELIKKGGHIVTSINDILEVYSDINFVKKEIIKKDIYEDISKDLIDVYKSISDIPKRINEICTQTGLSVSDVNYKIMILEMENKVDELPGQMFIRKRED